MKPGTYAFTCFNTNTLATMRRADPSAPIGYIVGTGLTEEHIATAKSLGCCGIAPLLSKTTKEMVARAHEEGLTICFWMSNGRDDLVQLRKLVPKQASESVIC